MIKPAQLEITKISYCDAGAIKEVSQIRNCNQTHVLEPIGRRMSSIRPSFLKAAFNLVEYTVDGLTGGNAARDVPSIVWLVQHSY